MLERFTPGARAVVERAQAEAVALRHGHIGTEHLLLGLPGEEHGIAGQALREVGMSAGAVRRAVQALVADSLVTGPEAEALRPSASTWSTSGVRGGVVRARRPRAGPLRWLPEG